MEPRYIFEPKQIFVLCSIVMLLLSLRLLKDAVVAVDSASVDADSSMCCTALQSCGL